MYRNCSEHPMIKEILRNGEPIDGGHRNIRAGNHCRDLELSEVYELSDEDFTAICVNRKIGRFLLEAEPCEAGLRRKEEQRNAREMT